MDDLADNELTALEDLISAWLIEATLAGRDTNYVDQLLSLITGYRESLLLIGKLLAEQEGRRWGWVATPAISRWGTSLMPSICACRRLQPPP
ncbi:hypothetical protein [Candidatus Reidiella endopervernicosa]|uniref:Uncharacterized protein n=1 Tax=Candidatus Reidiella endopervernicosa TaxID=2738883 RepID=A0A6N0HRT2_9GAMM|nr:hypothetical protein [Candidatus Reidiella endopervernicosa]QKQ24986.1 hypothetical protein HUE57_00815 [Candidatus Reidiella endopervernicosa]